MMKKQSPYILEHSWGQIKVKDNGDEAIYRDAKLYPGGSREWDWNETGTHHQPGIQPADVKELIENGAKVLVLSRGIYQRLGVSNETIKWLDELGLEYHIDETKKAIQIYNNLREEREVGGLFHSTC